MSSPKSTRITNVQVPGAMPPAQPESVQKASFDSAKQEVIEAKQAEAGAPGTTFDLEAFREQARNEARAELHAEIRAAKAVADKPAESIARSQHDYRNMRAVDIDPSTLSAPVLTRDGYLCPPAPEKK